MAVTTALEEVRKSSRSSRVLELVLLMGNLLNAGHRNGQCHAFDLSFLSRMSQTKTRDNRATLVHFLAELVHARFSDLEAFTDDLAYLDRAAKGVCA